MRLLALAVCTTVVALGLAACGPELPDDLSSLLRFMNSNDEVTAVAAANKIQKMYGKEGLLRALREGGPTARSLGPRWLVNFPARDVEQALIQQAERKTEQESARVAALSGLRDIGTADALPHVKRLKEDTVDSVSAMAIEAERSINARITR